MCLISSALRTTSSQKAVLEEWKLSHRLGTAGCKSISDLEYIKKIYNLLRRKQVQFIKSAKDLAVTSERYANDKHMKMCIPSLIYREV